MKISILEALSQQRHDPPVIADGDRCYCDNGLLTMSDGVFKIQLEELGIEVCIISDLMLEPPTERDNFLEYYRGRLQG